MIRHASIAVVVLWAGFTMASENVTDTQLREAAQRSLPLIQSSAVEFTKHRECFSCHHQALAVRVMDVAATRGFAVDGAFVQQQVDWTAAFLRRNQEQYLQGKGQGGAVDTAGYALWTLAVADYAPNELTAAVCQYMLLRQADKDHWERVSVRPPSEGSNFTTTFVAIESLKRFATETQREQANQRIAAARAWLEATPAIDTEDMVFRLRGLCAADADKQKIAEATAQLVSKQHEDGGWSQRDDMTSDAYATGSALMALVECGQVASHDARYQRGLRWLLEHQQTDGSWQVETRSDPIQEYFETGFPHEEDQFISMAATCWAVLAILRALPETPSDTAVAATEHVPPDDARQAITAVLDQQVTAWNAGDLEKFMDTYWRSDELSFSAAGEITRGWQATFDRYRQRYPDQQQMGKLTISDLEITMLGESAAMVLGQWQLERGYDCHGGKFTLVMRTVDGHWRIIHDHTSRRAAE